MSSSRREELQRKLSLHEVPRPPAGLAERIKADIPEHLRAAEAQRRPRRFGAGLRVAASVAFLIASGAIAVFLMTPDAEREMATATLPASPRPVPVVVNEAPVAVSAAPAEQARLEVAPAPATRKDIPTAETRMAFAVETGDEGRITAAREAGHETGTARADASPAIAEQPAEITESFVAEAEAPALAAPQPAVAQASGREPLARSAAREEAKAEQRLMKSAGAPATVARARPTILGLSVDRDAFERVRASIEAGSRPPAPAVDVEALVNYFAGGPARPPQRGVALETEASPSPVPPSGDRAILRFSVDAARVEAGGGAPAPTVARDVRVDVEIDRGAVASFRRIGGTDAIAVESQLSAGASVTAVYELELQPRVAATRNIARVRLSYVSATDGKRHVVERRVLGRDLARPWPQATRRHRLAALGAAWAETLRGRGGGAGLARRAEELAAERPQDELARQLATITSASSRIAGSPPAGGAR